MKKTYSFNVMSDKICAFASCDKRLKLRLVKQKPSTTICYKHYKETETDRGHTIDSQARKKRVCAGLPVKSY